MKNILCLFLCLFFFEFQKMSMSDCFINKRFVVIGPGHDMST